jgi:hypothetical protein
MALSKPMVRRSQGVRNIAGSCVVYDDSEKEGLHR